MILEATAPRTIAPWPEKSSDKKETLEYGDTQDDRYEPAGRCNSSGPRTRGDGSRSREAAKGGERAPDGPPLGRPDRPRKERGLLDAGPPARRPGRGRARASRGSAGARGGGPLPATPA